jgi:hypothetical protein
MKTIAVRCLVALMLLLTCGTLGAHHSPAAFDLSQEVRIEGTLTKFVYSNPHTYLTIEVVAPDGTRMSQEVEVGPISVVQPLGLTRDALHVGERVMVRARPHRRGAGYTVLGLDLTRADGKTFSLYSGPANVRPSSNAVAASLAGTWQPAREGFSALNKVIGSWPLTEEGRKRLTDARQANFTTQSDCIPAGAPMLMVYPVAVNVEVDNRTIVFDIDWLGAKRVVHLDVATHPSELAPSLQGHSIGRWEGQTLVVDTVGFAAHDEGIGFGMPSSAGKHLAERFTLAADRRTLTYEVTVADPQYLERPVAFTANWQYSPELRASGVECDLEIARRYLRETDAVVQMPADRPAPDVGGGLFRITLFGVAGLVGVLGIFAVRKWRRRG